MREFGDRGAFFLILVGFLLLPALKEFSSVGAAQPEFSNDPRVGENLKGSKIPLKTDDEVLSREEEALSSDGYSVEEQRLIRSQEQRYPFQAEVNRVMSIIINSLYSNKDIFLRELISNASDALDKVRFLSLTDPSLLGEQSKLEIRIKADPEKNVLHITDTGIGMTKDDLISKLGTIAKSGTREFSEAIKSADVNLIGQFGVGFYSAFLVADTITVTTKNNDDPKQWIWKSTAESSFTITEDPQGPTLGRGTRITLHLKKDASEYADSKTLETLIKRYSEFINFPIYLWSSQEVTEPETPTSEDTTNEEVSLEEKEDNFEVSEEEADQKAADSGKKQTKTVHSWQLQNENKPIWLRNPKDVTEEEYNNFYKSFSKDVQDPLTHLHFSGEGEIDFKAILYVPATSPTGLFDPDKAREHRGLRLYVKRVFITDDFSDMLPRYLNFIKGMVDSDNLPLNVSREVLQQDRTLSLIKKKLVRKVIAMIQELAEDNEKYEKFWEQYGTAIKLGVADDQHNRTRLSKLLRFHSSKTKKLTSLEDYVSRMKEGQTQIYYLAGESQDAVSNSPFVEKLLRKGFEVLFMTEPIDEWSIQSLNKFDNKHLLTNVAKEGLKLDDKQSDEDKQKEKDVTEEFKDLLDFLKTHLENKVSKAAISQNLVKTPSAITSGTYGFTANMERLMKAQAFADQKQFAYMKGQRVLEINPKHPIIIELNRRVLLDASDPVANDLALLLYDTASLHSGYSLDDAPGFANRIHTMMKLSLGLDKNAEAESDPDDFSEEQTEFSQTSLRDEL